MKNKRITYLLLTLVALIWGMVIYRIVFSKNNDVQLAIEDQFILSEKNNDNSLDSFEIIAKYRDPFLGTRIISNSQSIVNNNSENSNKNRKVKNIIIKEEINWPIIKFSGIIHQTTKMTIVGLLTINNVEYIVRSGEEVEQVRVNSIYRDSIVLLYKNEMKTVNK